MKYNQISKKIGYHVFGVFDFHSDRLYYHTVIIAYINLEIDTSDRVCRYSSSVYEH